MKPLPVVLVALVLLTAPLVGATSTPGAPTDVDVAGADAAATGDGLPSVVSAENRTLYNVLTLSPSSVNRTNFSSPRSDLGASLSMRNDRLDRQLSHERASNELDSFEDDSEKQAYIRRALTEVEIRTSELRENEREAFRKHSTGELGTREFLVRLARIDSTAEQLSANVTQLERGGEEIDGFSVTGRADSLKYELRTFQGPVRERVGEVLRGNVTSMKIYVSTTDTGVVLTTIANGFYVREVYDSSKLISKDDQLVRDDIEGLMWKNYPQLMQRGTYGARTSRSSGYFISEIPYSRGYLRAYIDKSKPGRVFKEEHCIRLDKVPPTKPMNTTEQGLTLTVYPSYSGGPMFVEVVDGETGDPVEADVSLVSPPQSARPTSIGATNASGVLWTLAPEQNFTVQAIGPGQRVVTLQLSPSEPNRVGNVSKADRQYIDEAESSALSAPTGVSSGTTLETEARPVRIETVG